MATIYTGTGKLFQQVDAVSLDEDSLKEMRKRIKLQPHFLGEPLVVIGEQQDYIPSTAESEGSLVALDVKGNAVLISLCSGVSAAEVSLQIIRDAAHIGTLHAQDLGKITRQFLSRGQNDTLLRSWQEKGVEMNEESVELASLLAAVFERDAEDYASAINRNQRIIIAAEGFNASMVESIDWLVRHGVAIVGLRYRRFLVGGQEIYFAEQVVPTCDPAEDAAGRERTNAPEASEPWLTKGKVYHSERLAPNVAARMDELLVGTRKATFSVNWSHKYYFWIRGAKRNLRVRTYHRDRLEIGFYNTSPSAVVDFLTTSGMEHIEVYTIGGYQDSPFIMLGGDAMLDAKWLEMLCTWLSGEA